GRSERLGPHLPELTVTTGLRSLVAEEARQVPQLHRLTALVHSVFHICPAHRRGALRAQRQRAARAVVEREHLLADDVRRLADRAREQLGRLERRRLDPFMAGTLEDRPRAGLQRAASARLLAEHVEGAARRFDLRDAQLPAAVAPGAEAGIAERSSARDGFVSRSRSSVVTPTCPGSTTVFPGNARSSSPIERSSVAQSPPGRSTRPTDP